MYEKLAEEEIREYEKLIVKEREIKEKEGPEFVFVDYGNRETVFYNTMEELKAKLARTISLEFDNEGFENDLKIYDLSNGRELEVKVTTKVEVGVS